MEVLELLEKINSNLEEIRKGIEDMGADNARQLKALEELNQKLEEEDAVDITE